MNIFRSARLCKVVIVLKLSLFDYRKNLVQGKPRNFVERCTSHSKKQNYADWEKGEFPSCFHQRMFKSTF